MRLQDLTWMDVERYLQRDNRIILVTGAVEQHGYLSLLTDSLIATRIAEAAGEREGVIVAPPLPFGVSQEFAEFPGTISLSAATYETLLIEIVENLMHQGFFRFFIVNGHAGNKLPPSLHEHHMEGLVRLYWYDWWIETAARSFEAEHGLKIDHANWSENYAFTRVGAVPAGEKAPINLELLKSGQSMRDIVGEGSFGGVYQLDDALMDALFNRVVDDVTGLLQRFGTN